MHVSDIVELATDSPFSSIIFQTRYARMADRISNICTFPWGGDCFMRTVTIEIYNRLICTHFLHNDIRKMYKYSVQRNIVHDYTVYIHCNFNVATFNYKP